MALSAFAYVWTYALLRSKQDLVILRGTSSRPRRTFTYAYDSKSQRYGAWRMSLFRPRIAAKEWWLNR